MSVNLSCRQFSQPDLVYQVERAACWTRGSIPGCLKMEITESAIMEQVESASSALSKLKSLGVKLAMDDFGKGYSSLSYLHQFPFDTLKIDRSFISCIGPRREHGDRANDHLAGSGPGAGRGRRGSRDGQPIGPATRPGMPLRPGVLLLAAVTGRSGRRAARGIAAVAGAGVPGCPRDPVASQKHSLRTQSQGSLPHGLTSSVRGSGADAIDVGPRHLSRIGAKKGRLLAGLHGASWSVAGCRSGPDQFIHAWQRWLVRGDGVTEEIATAVVRNETRPRAKGTPGRSL